MALTVRQQEVKDEFIRVRGTWSAGWEAILTLDSEFLLSYLGFSAVPWRKSALEPKHKELIYIAVDSAATHLYEPGIRQHIDAALDHGATPAEIMEVLELASTIGIHACNVGVPLLLEVLTEEGIRTAALQHDEHREELKVEFTRKRGYWNEFWDGLLELDPELFEAYLDFSAVPWTTGPLPPKVKELIYIAVDASATHMFGPGLKLHLRNALRLDASVAEIMEVFDIISVIGIHAATSAAPLLADALQARQGAEA